MTIPQLEHPHFAAQELRTRSVKGQTHGNLGGELSGCTFRAHLDGADGLKLCKVRTQSNVIEFAFKQRRYRPGHADTSQGRGRSMIALEGAGHTW